MAPTPTPTHAATTILAGPGAAHSHNFSDLAATRDLFWQNIVREMLTSLAVVADQRRSQIVAELHTSLGQMKVEGATITTAPDLVTDPRDEEDVEDELPPGMHPEMPLDGRMAVLTKGGERIPIADVRPLLACSVPGTEAERNLSIDVQCTIFQIVAPSGEVFTLPLHEIRAVHAISEDLMRKMQEAARQQDASSGREGDDPETKPFGFAAFTSLARNQSKPPPAR